MDNKEEIKKFLKESLGIVDEVELEKFAASLLEKAELYDALPSKPRTAKIWKKEEIEAQGIEVIPFDWKKFV
jgi:N-dimethylarginine dimethylaminohydrolase